MPGACACGALLAFCGECMAGSPLIIKDLDLYPQPPTNIRSPTLNSEESLIDHLPVPGCRYILGVLLLACVPALIVVLFRNVEPIWLG